MANRPLPLIQGTAERLRFFNATTKGCCSGKNSEGIPLPARKIAYNLQQLYTINYLIGVNLLQSTKNVIPETLLAGNPVSD
jgi:hypothetical protein